MLIAIYLKCYIFVAMLNPKNGYFLTISGCGRR